MDKNVEAQTDKVIENTQPASSREAGQIESVDPQGPHLASVGFTPGLGPKIEDVMVRKPRWRFWDPLSFQVLALLTEVLPESSLAEEP